MTERPWILAETFRPPRHEPTVLAIGQEPKRMKPLAAVVRGGGYLPEVRTMIVKVAATGRPYREPSRDGRRQLIGVPLASAGGCVHGVYAWYGPFGEEPPPRPAAGAWHFNLTAGTTNRSDDLFDLYGTPPGAARQYTAYTAEAFWPRLVPGPDEPGALAVLVRAKPGMEYHGRRWIVRREPAGDIYVNLWCRAMEATGAGGRQEIIVRGITQAIGPVAAAPSEPQPIVTIQQRVIAAECRPGWHRAIVDLETLALVRWVDPPMPGIAWEVGAGHKPAIRREDLRRAKEMSDQLATSSRVEGVLRLRSTSGGWQAVHVAASLMLLDQHTTAALVTLSAPHREQG